MIELYELRQLAAFADTGTLSEAAEILHLSQPALSRNMKKLEDDLGISLFDRTKNRIELNDNGQYMLELAKKLLVDADSLAAKVRDYDRKSRTIMLGLCAPAPVWFLTPLMTELFPHLSLQTEQDTVEKLLSGLDDNVYQLITLPKKPEGKQYFSKKCGRETLMFALPKGHKYARRKSLSFSDMNGENMLLMPDIGFWSFVMEKMPDSRFLTQNDRFSFNELVQASSLPSFVTNLSEKYRITPSGRICVPISDEEATVTYYLICKAENKKMFSSLFQSI
ncbi:LysR family transcriptional regulator [Lactonifactor longoviformis]|uniref:LysR family transcriptional regulator n=1 Tax=Lactonifactor longoviformis TaxID=341220 RepID=UPI0036F3BD4C